MFNQTCYINISKLYTLNGGVRTGEKLKDCAIIEDAYFVVKDGIISEIGEMKDFKSTKLTNIVDLKQQIVTPGFIDAHTHLVFAGSRNQEYIDRMNNIDYLTIHKNGGGILSTVKATANATFNELYLKAKNTALFMLSKGVTTVEVKSGYGLDFTVETRTLKVVRKLNKMLNMEFIPTYMGAHAFPTLMSQDEYVDLMLNKVIPYVRKENLAIFIDVFTEKGVYDIKQTEKIFNRAKELGFKLKIHADEMYPLGGARIAAKYHCTSADHLLNAKKEDLLLMKDSNVTATLLPMTSFNLSKPCADINFMKEIGLVISLASDYNPGSSPISDFMMMLRLSSRIYKLTPNEILSMVTINGASAIDKVNEIGSLEVNKQADFIVFDSDSFDDIIINMGPTKISSVYKRGKLAYRRKDNATY